MLVLAIGGWELHYYFINSTTYCFTGFETTKSIVSAKKKIELKLVEDSSQKLKSGGLPLKGFGGRFSERLDTIKVSPSGQ
jgi:hypothetical protein